MLELLSVMFAKIGMMVRLRFLQKFFSLRIVNLLNLLIIQEIFLDTLMPVYLESRGVERIMILGSSDVVNNSLL